MAPIGAALHRTRRHRTEHTAAQVLLSMDKLAFTIFISFSFAHAGVLETEFHAELQNARIVRIHRMHERNAAQATLVAAVSGKVH